MTLEPLKAHFQIVIQPLLIWFSSYDVYFSIANHDHPPTVPIALGLSGFIQRKVLKLELPILITNMIVLVPQIEVQCVS